MYIRNNEKNKLYAGLEWDMVKKKNFMIFQHNFSLYLMGICSFFRALYIFLRTPDAF